MLNIPAGFHILIPQPLPLPRCCCSIFFQNTIVEASIQLPPSLFSPKQKREVRPTDDSLYKLQLIAFRNGKLFPATGNSTNLADDGKRRTVVTPVILTKIGLCLAYANARLIFTVPSALIAVPSCFNEPPAEGTVPLCV